MSGFRPRLEVLPAAQRSLWGEIGGARNCGFVLYRGTALALRLGHRNSEDFDFFSSGKIDRPKLYALVPGLSQSNVIQDTPRSLSLLVPSQNEFVKISFFGEIKTGRVGEPQLTDDRVCEIASEPDLFATKLKVLLERIEAKDYRDVAALLRHGISLEKGLGAARALYGKQFSPESALKALTYFEPAELSSLGKNDRGYLIDCVSNVDQIEPAQIKSKQLSLET